MIIDLTYSNLKKCLFNKQKQVKTKGLFSNKIESNYKKSGASLFLEIESSTIIKIKNKSRPSLCLDRNKKFKMLRNLSGSSCFNLNDFYLKEISFLYTHKFLIYLEYLCNQKYFKFLPNNEGPSLKENKFVKLNRNSKLSNIKVFKNNLFNLKDEKTLTLLNQTNEFNSLLKKNYKMIYFFKNLKNPWDLGANIEYFKLFFNSFFVMSFLGMQKKIKKTTIQKSLTNIEDQLLKFNKKFKNSNVKKPLFPYFKISSYLFDLTSQNQNLEQAIKNNKKSNFYKVYYLKYKLFSLENKNLLTKNNLFNYFREGSPKENMKTFLKMPRNFFLNIVLKNKEILVLRTHMITKLEKQDFINKILQELLTMLQREKNYLFKLNNNNNNNKNLVYLNKIKLGLKFKDNFYKTEWNKVDHSITFNKVNQDFRLQNQGQILLINIFTYILSIVKKNNLFKSLNYFRFKKSFNKKEGFNESLNEQGTLIFYMFDRTYSVKPLKLTTALYYKFSKSLIQGLLQKILLPSKIFRFPNTEILIREISNTPCKSKKLLNFFSFYKLVTNLFILWFFNLNFLRSNFLPFGIELNHLDLNYFKPLQSIKVFLILPLTKEITTLPTMEPTMEIVGFDFNTLLLNNNYLLNNLIKRNGNAPYSILLVYINMHNRFLTKFILFFYLKFLFVKTEKTIITSKLPLKNRSSRINLKPSWMNVAQLNHLSYKNQKRLFYNKTKIKQKTKMDTKINLLFQSFHKNKILLINIANQLNTLFRKPSLIFLITRKGNNLNLINTVKTLFINSISNKQSLLKQETFLIPLNSNLWQFNKKLHNQNSLKWIFKKYWIITFYYKKKTKNDKLLIPKVFKYNYLLKNHLNYNKVLCFQQNYLRKTFTINILDRIKDPTQWKVYSNNKLTSTLISKKILGVKTIFFKKNILTFILKSKSLKLSHSFLLTKEIIMIKYFQIHSKRLLFTENQKNKNITQKYYLLKTFLLYRTL